MSPWQEGWQGPTTGAAAIPTAPTISLSISGTTATVTVNGDAGLSNVVYYQSIAGGAWTTGGTVVGDGDVVITGLAANQYIFVAQTFNGTTPSGISNTEVGFVVSSDLAFGDSPAVIIAEYLIEAISKMTSPSDRDTWPLYTSHLPDGSDVASNAGCVYDSPGTKDGRLMSGPIVEHHGVQIKIRSLDHQIGYAKLDELSKALDEISYQSIVVNTVTYQIRNASRLTPVTFIGLEEGTKRRDLFTVNYLTTIFK